jgi:hypothetical protein
MLKKKKFWHFYLIFCLLIFNYYVGFTSAQSESNNSFIRLYPTNDSSITSDFYAQALGGHQDLIIGFTGPHIYFALIEFDVSNLPSTASALSFQANLEKQNTSSQLENQTISLIVWAKNNLEWDDKSVTNQNYYGIDSEFFTRIRDESERNSLKTNMVKLSVKVGATSIRFPIENDFWKQQKTITLVLMTPYLVLNEIHLNSRESESPIFLEITHGQLILLGVMLPVISITGIIYIVYKKRESSEPSDNSIYRPTQDVTSQPVPKNCCPGCYHPYSPKDKICVFCGYTFQEKDD